jgi:hypothetical protein
MQCMIFASLKFARNLGALRPDDNDAGMGRKRAAQPPESRTAYVVNAAPPAPGMPSFPAIARLRGDKIPYCLPIPPQARADCVFKGGLIQFRHVFEDGSALN